MHRRNSSKEESDDVVIGLNGVANTNGHANGFPEGLQDAPSRRIRVNSTPLKLHPQNPQESQLPPLPPSAGPHKTSFAFPRSPTANGTNGHPPQSPFRSSFGHMRNSSLSSSYAPAPPSPLSFSFPPQNSAPSPSSPSGGIPMTSSVSAPGAVNGSDSAYAAKQSRRHSRIHSRNLSVFFPRPGSLPTPTIAEDGAQELEIGNPEPVDIPRAEPTPLGVGFKFGSQPPASVSAGLATSPTPMGASSSSSRSRKGHHHKHSMSHNFFSFLEPGANGGPSPAPTDDPRSASMVPSSASGWATGTKTAFEQPPVIHSPPPSSQITFGAVGMSLTQFVLGAWLWIAGQQTGSLSCAGLGYWVVFDSLGVAVGTLLPGYLAKPELQKKFRRPYGNARVETVSLFAQAVYLLFAGVYVIKETLEHFLLSADNTEGHHHHHGGESPGSIDFPLLLIFLSLLTTTFTASAFNNHSRLVTTTGNRIPSLNKIARALFSRSSSSHSDSYSSPPPDTLSANILSNPYIVCPISFGLAIMAVPAFASPARQQLLDMVLAAFIATVTFKVAYEAAVVIGAVLLQTSPQRNLSGGRMESFLRAMREVERNPQVLHLPAPHIWQLTPSTTTGSGGFVVTMELHVRPDLGDDDVLMLTRWAWEKCDGALRSFKREAWEGDEMEKTEVTVGVVRG